MKRHSILSTLFPRLGFNRFRGKKLLSLASFKSSGVNAYSEPLSPYICRVKRNPSGEFGHALVANFLPTFFIDKVRVATHLNYMELSATDDIFVKTQNQAVVFLKPSIRDSDGNFINLKRIEGDSDDSIYRRFFNLWLEKKVSKIDLTINVCISKDDCGDDIVGDETRLMGHLSQRREYVARELTTGYRRCISRFIIALKAKADADQHLDTQKAGLVAPIQKAFINSTIKATKVVSPEALNRADSELHSTQEDAWRLLCTFSGIEKIVKNRSIEALHSGSSVNPVLDMDSCVASFLEFSVNGTTGIMGEALQEFYSSKAVRNEIAAKKILEYYLYEEICCTPCGK